MLVVHLLDELVGGHVAAGWNAERVADTVILGQQSAGIGTAGAGRLGWHVGVIHSVVLVSTGERVPEIRCTAPFHFGGPGGKRRRPPPQWPSLLWATVV